MLIRIQQEAFDPWRELAAAGQALSAGKVGGTAVFVGSLRDFNQGHAVSAMSLEHYPGMTEAHLKKVCTEAAERWDILDSFVIHRYGPLTPGESIVLVAVWAAHRDPAFQACRYIIDELKTRAPFWKHESTPQGDRWVEPE